MTETKDKHSKHELAFAKRFYSADGNYTISQIEISIVGTSAQELRSQFEFLISKQGELNPK